MWGERKERNRIMKAGGGDGRGRTQNERRSDDKRPFQFPAAGVAVELEFSHPSNCVLFSLFYISAWQPLLKVSLHFTHTPHCHFLLASFSFSNGTESSPRILFSVI